MKVSYPIIFQPANATEEAAVPTGALVIRSGETEVKIKSASGIESVSTPSSVATALATIAIKDWQAATVVTLNEVRRATVAAGTIELGDLIRSNSARTTGATFDATEAGNWTEFSLDIVTSVAGQTGAVVLAKADVALGSVDNTSDAGKPVSTAQATAIGLKADSTALIAHTGSTANPHGVTKAQVGLTNADNTADSAKPVSTAQQTALNLKQDASTAATDAELTAHTGNVANPHGVTKAQVGLANAENTTDLLKPVSTATQTALDAKQATLVSGTNLRPVNGSSLLGSSNLTIAADLPGGAATTVTNEGLVTTGSPSVDTATVPGETIIRWTGAGNFTVPIGVMSVRALLVGGGGGGGGGEGVAAGDGGGGGGAGELLDQSSFVVVPGATLALTVGGGGAGANSLGGQTGANGTNGTNSTFGTLTARGGGGGGGNDLAANAGGSGGGGGGRCSSGIDLAGGAVTAVSPGVGFAGGAGTGVCTNRDGGGGGGAGGIGGSSSGTGAAGIAGTGGAAVTSNITGLTMTYAGGGGGGIGGGQGVVGAGGSANSVTVGGVGGASDSAGGVGAANTGGGGGGGGARASEGQASGAAGGSGVVIIRFPTQTRSYQALAGYASDAAAATGGILVGQFYRDSTTGAVRQRVS